MMREGIATAVPNRAAISLCALSLLALAGCGNSDVATAPGTEAADADAGDEGEWGDAGLSPDFAGRSSGEPVPGDDGGSGIGAAPPSSDDLDGCFATGDPEAGTFDCNDAACERVRSCRIGSGQLCTAASTVNVFDGACDGEQLTSLCIGVAGDVFGSPRPWVAGGGVHPGGRDFDSGFYLDAPSPLRSERLKLEGTFAAPLCADTATCAENVAFGVTDRMAFDATTRVRAAAALEYRAARNEVALLIEDVTVFRHAYEPAKATWALELTPDGRAHVWNGEVELDDFAYAPRGGLRVVVFGRNSNHGYPDSSGARLSGFTSTTSACDIPDAWMERGEVSFTLATGGSPYAARRPASATVATGPGSAANPAQRRWIAFDEVDEDGEGHIFGAFETSAGLSEFKLGHEIVAPLLSPSPGHQAASVRDPELAYSPGDRPWHLYYTAEDAEGRLTIGHAAGPTVTDLSADAAPLIDPAGWHDLEALEMPTIATAADGRRVIVVRATITDGSHRLVGFVEYLGGADPQAGTEFERITGGLGDLTARDGTGSHGGFDADEIAQPSLINWDGAFHLYYAGRRGTRWGIGLLASDNFLTFRVVTPTTPILSGDDAGFDALGVRGADIEIVDGLAVAIYEGTDGSSSGIGFAQRPTPEPEAP